MRADLTDVQYSLVISTTAKIPPDVARKPVLVKLEALLRARGRVRDAALIRAINDALAAYGSIEALAAANARRNERLSFS